MDKSEFWDQARPGFLPFQSDRITGSKKHKFICNLTNHKRTTREIVKSKKGPKKDGIRGFSQFYHSLA